MRVRARAFVCVRACARARARACVCACVRAFVRVCARGFVACRFVCPRASGRMCGSDRCGHIPTCFPTPRMGEMCTRECGRGRVLCAMRNDWSERLPLPTAPAGTGAAPARQ
eukprot:gene16215-biopygen17239